MNLKTVKILGEIKPPQSKSLDLMYRRDKVFPPCLTKRATGRILIEGEGVYQKDLNGNWYISWASQSKNVGYNHPQVTSAIQKQVTKPNPLIRIKLAEKVKEIAPSSLSKGKVFFSRGGGDAAEFSMKLTRHCSKKPIFIACQGSFHGSSMGSLSITFAESKLRGYSHPLLSDVVHVPFPYCYRCTFGQSYPDCDFECIRYIDYVLETVAHPEATAAFFIEPMQGHGGGVIAPDGYFKRLRKLCDENEILLVDDEVVCGMGRMGKKFGIENWGVEPDLIFMGKPLADGLPMGAGIGKKELMEKWDEACPRASALGHDICCAASLATINVIQEKGLIANAMKLGGYMLKRLKEMSEEHKLIGDVRGKGLYLGLEFVKNRDKKTPATKETAELVGKAAKKGLLLMRGGPYRQSLRIVPPLIVTEEEVDIGLNIFDETLKEVE